MSTKKRKIGQSEMRDILNSSENGEPVEEEPTVDLR